MAASLHVAGFEHIMETGCFGTEDIMQIHRQKALQAFADYVKDYDAEDPKVRLKIDHTYRVAGFCQRIAESLELSRADIDLAWLSGLLHDVGRFEQLRNYGTFIDARSIDHAMYGAEILFDQGKIRDYVEDGSEDGFLRKVISCHSAYRIPEDYDERTTLFANILRDADKVDILRVNVETPLEEIYNVSTEVLRSEPVTPQVLQAFQEGHTVLRALKRTAVDNVVGHISLVFELMFPVSLHMVAEQGYLNRLMDFRSENPDTVRDFILIRKKMAEYLETAETVAHDHLPYIATIDF
ncbi:MAG: HD domain-containing protein [Lachnospiraceae bacterium]|nr:HD domain-containing protein [Lachnospiraceae bacterium]